MLASIKDTIDTANVEAVIAEGEAILEELRNRDFTQNEADVQEELQYAREGELIVLVGQFSGPRISIKIIFRGMGIPIIMIRWPKTISMV